ncbi:hypothetical protein CsSME_00017198 [Camellia sinensis var. sinensis]
MNKVFAAFWYSGILHRLFCTDSLSTHPFDLITDPTTTTTFENHKSLSQPQSAKKAGTKAKQQQQNQSFEKELQEMQEKVQQLRIEKEQTEELLKAREETLKTEEEELEARGKKQEKLQMELKKLQKMKEFKPTMVPLFFFFFFFPLQYDIWLLRKCRENERALERVIFLHFLRN